MTTTQTKIDTLRAQLDAINDQRHDIRENLEYASNRLAQARLDLAKTHASLKAGEVVEASDLLTDIRDVSDLEDMLAHLEQTSGKTLIHLDEQAANLRAQISTLGTESRKAALGEAVMAYQAALCAALPLADEVIRAAAAACVLLPVNSDPTSLILQRGFYAVGGITLDLGRPLSGKSV